jgi:hypothetical protein
MQRLTVLRAAAALTALGLVGGAPVLAPGDASAAERSRTGVRIGLLAPGSVPTGAYARLKGRVADGRRGKVQLQRRVEGVWRPVARQRLSRRSAFSFRQWFPVAGATTYRVVLLRGGGKSPRRTVAAVPPGHDVSYPQCGAPLPVGSTFGVVGVDGGKPYDVNPCLTDQIGWALATGRLSYYVNTANPGPRLSSYWPLGQRSPKRCSRGAPDSRGCAYDYGWNAAEDSFARAVAAAAAAGAPAVTRSAWWLDVETMNTWESLEYGHTAKYLANDTAVLEGMRDYLRSRGVRTVGVYSTSHQWERITGGASLGRAPVWYAGVGSATTAAKRCTRAHAFTGGRVRMAQFARDGFDANHRC